MTLYAVEESIGAPEEDPFFILFDSRSGSTFLANELSKKFKVSIPPETNFVTYALGRFGHLTFSSSAQLDSLVTTIMSEPKFVDLGIDEADLRYLFAQFAPITIADAVRITLDCFRQQRGLDSYRYGIKKGNYIYHYHDLLRMFPSAKFVGLVRDGRAVFNSKKRSVGSSKGKPMETDPRKAARQWVGFTNRLRNLEVDYPGVMIVNYETLIEKTDETVSEVAEFLDAKPIAAGDNSNTYEITPRYDKDLHSNINKMPLSERITAWKSALRPKEIATYESVARDCLKREGYELLNTTSTESTWNRWLSFT